MAILVSPFLVGISPFAALSLAALGGLLLGWKVGDVLEGSFARGHTAEASVTWTAIQHWLIVAAIGLNYAWFILSDHPFRFGVLLLFILIALRWGCIRSLFLQTPLDVPITVLLLLTFTFSVVTSVKPALSYPKLYGVAFSVLLFYEMVFGLQQKANLARWLLLLCLLGLAVAGLGLISTDWFLNKVFNLSEIYALIPRKVVSVPRSLRGGFHPNGIAGTLIFLLPVYAVAWKGKWFHSPLLQRFFDALAIFTLIITMLMLLLTQSRGAVAGLLIAGVALAFALKGQFRLSLLSMTSLLLLGAVFLTSLSGLANAVASVPGSALRQLLHSSQFRLQAWSLGLKVLKAFPLKSRGIGTFDHVVRYIFPQLYPRNLWLGYPYTITHAHNEFLQVAIDLGILGFVAYVVLWATFVRTTWRVYTWAPDDRTRRLVLGIAAGLLAHQVFGLTDAFMLGTKPGIVMWILMGIITGMYLNLAPEHLAEERAGKNDET